MAVVSTPEIRRLLDHTGPCASVFLPTHRTGQASRQDPIRLKNLVNETEERLVEHGVNRSKVQAMLTPVRRALEDSAFWQHQSDGLAIYIAQDYVDMYRVPLELEERLCVGERFHVKPLLPLLHDDGRFYVIGVSPKGIRFFRGTRTGIDELWVEGFPEGLPGSRAEDYEPQGHLYSHSTRTAGRTAATEQMFPGHGEIRREEPLLRFLRETDRAATDVLRGEKAPLVFAGVEELFPLYREVNSYDYLAGEFIHGNPEITQPGEFHKQGWKIAEAIFRQRLSVAAENFHTALSRGRATDDLCSVLRAAWEGRVGTLFLARDAHQWGTFDPVSGTLIPHTEPQDGCDDLLDFAAMETIRHDGEVFAVPQAEIPGGGTASAILRYSVSMDQEASVSRRQ